MKKVKGLLDEQRKILHDRLTELTSFDSDSERSDFVLDVMKDLPYPDYASFDCDNGNHDFDYMNKANGKITCKNCKKEFPYG